MDLLDHIKIIRRHKIAFFLPLFVCVFLYPLFQVPEATSYSSYVNIQLKFQDQQWLIGDSPSPFSQPEMLTRSTIKVNINSQQFNDKLDEEFDKTYEDLADKDYQIYVMPGTSFDPNFEDDKQTMILHIKIVSTSAEVCQNMLDIFTSSYEAFASDFAKKSLTRTETKLQEVQGQNLQEFNDELLILQEDENYEDIIRFLDINNIDNVTAVALTKLNVIHAKLDTLIDDIAAIQATIAKGQRNLKSFDASFMNTSARQEYINLQTEITNKKENYRIATATYVAGSEPLLTMLNDIHLLEQEFNQRAGYLETFSRHDLKDELYELSISLGLKEQKLEALQKQDDKQQYLIKALSSLRNKQQEVKAAKMDFDEVRKLTSLERDYLNVISKSQSAYIAMPEKYRSIVVAIVLGLISGMLLAYIIDITSSSLQTEHDVRKYLGIPVLFNVVKAKRHESALISDWSPESAPVELFRSFAQMMAQSLLVDGQKIIQITSPQKSEGKSTISSNLAIAMSMIGKRVLLIDNDLKKPMIYKNFNIDNVGLSEYYKTLKADPNSDITLQSLYQDAGYENLSVLAAGSFRSDTMEIYKSPIYTKIFDLIREDFDVILVDSPPVVTSDNIMIAINVDMLLLVLSMGETDKYIAQKCKRLLAFSNINVAGAILNKCPREGRSAHYYYYGKGYRNHD